MKHLLRFKTFLLLAIFSLLAGTSALAQSTSTLTFAGKCSGSGTADDNVAWTVTSDGTESTFDSDKGIHYGTSKGTVKYIQLSTSGISGTITKVVVNASTASGVSATVDVTVGGNAFGGNAQSLTTSAADYTFTGSAEGNIVVTVTKPSSATKALYVKSVAVTYTPSGGSSLDPCDLALDGAPVALSFDLYNNSASQTINYTTSSTGLIDIDGEYNFPYVGTYATFDVDEVNKTITVTPTAVTPSTQTITVNQTGDANYYGGSVTFKLDITDSTPLPTHTATFSINGTTSSEDFEEGSAIVFPTNIADIEGKQFVGWTLDEISGTTDTAPALVNSAAMGTSDVTYYAVFATVSGSFSQETITIDKGTQNVPTSYGDAKTFNLYTFEGIDFSVQQMYLNGSNQLQWRAAGNSNGTGTMYNNDDLGKITSVVLTYSENDANKNFTLEIGNNADPTGGQAITPTANGSVYTFDCSAYDYGYFVMTNGSGAGYLDKLVINYTTGSAIISGYCTTVAADNRLEPGLAFYPATATYDFGIDTFVSLSYNTGFNGYDEVTYSSSDEDVVQVVDAQTGEIYMKSAGTATITATFLGNNEYKPGTATLEITVNDSRTPTTISQDPIVLDLSEVGTLTKLAPVVKDDNDNVVSYTYGVWPTEVSFEIVNDPNGVVGYLENNSGDITINSVVGTAELKAYYNLYTVNNNYRPSECTFTITVYQAKDGIAEFCTLNNNESGTLKLTNAVVLYTHGNDMFVKDATGAMDFYSTSLSYNVGDVLNGTITGTYKLYNNMPELTTPISENTLVATAGSAPTPDEITTSDAADNVCNFVKLSSAAVTENSGKFYVDNVQVYDKFKLGYTIEAGKTYDIVGIMIPYNSTYELCPTEAPVEVSTSTTPSITISPDSYTMDAKAGGGELPVTCSNMPADPQLEVLFYESDGTTPATYTWISAVINSNGNIDGQIEENTGDARTAYFKVHGVDANNNDVYSNLVTFTQSGPSIEFENPSIDIAASGESRTLGFDYAGVGSTADDFEVCFYESDGNTAATYDWITPSFKTESSKVKLDITVDANTGVARTAYFKVHAKNTTVYSNLYTVNQAAAPAATEINLTKTLVFDTSCGLATGSYAANDALTELSGTFEGDANATSFGGFTIKDSYINGGSIQMKKESGSITFPTIVSEYGFDVNVVYQTNYAKVYINGVESTEASAGNTSLMIATGDKYCQITSITLTPKTNVTTPSITLPGGYDYTMDAKAGGGELPVTCSNMPADPQLEVLFYESDGTTSATYDWISATINANGNIDGQIQENTGAARTAYFKVHGVDADNNDVYSNLVTFTQEAPVAATPTIVFNPNSIDFDANSGYRTIGGDFFQLKDFDSTPSLEILYYESDGDTEKQGGYDWLTADFNSNNQIDFAWNTNTGAARSAYLKIHAVGTTVYSNLFTVNQAAANVAHYYQKVTADADLADGQYLIVYEEGTVAFDGGLDALDAVNNTISVTIVGDKIEGNSTTDAAAFTIDLTAGTLKSASGLYIGQTSDANGLKADGSTAYQNTLSIDADGNADVISSSAHLRYNATSGQDRFRYFKSASYTGQKAIQLYKRVEGAMPAYVATPTFDPAAGEVQAGTLVTISTTTANATIRYTTDGSEPTTSNGEEYQKPIVINSDVTIKAIAVDDNQNVSAVAEATYTIATSSQLSPELTLDPKSLNVTEGAANGTVTVTTAAGYNGTITVMVDDPSVADASYDAGVITVVYGHAGSAVISVTAGADGDYVEQMEQISVNVSAPVQPAQAGVVVWSEDWSSFDLSTDGETPAANGDFTYVYTNGDNATKLYDDVLAGGTSPELLINKNGGAFSATIPLYGAYGNMTLTFKTNNKLSEIRAKVDDDTNNNITADPATVNGKNVYTLSFPVAEGANQVVLTFTNSSSKNLRIDDFQLTAPQVAVNISSVGYATMYYGSSNLVVPAGVTASTYWVDGDLLKVSQEYTEGAVLAKAQGYILNGAPGSYTFTATNDAANEDPKNLLCGSDVAVTTTAPVAGNFLFYLLGVDNGKVGFYWGKDNGAAFTSGAHKAYLAVPENAANGIRAFYFDDVFTGVDNLNLNVENENAYDMQGRRVQQLQKGGLYIINGKKMLAK